MFELLDLTRVPDGTYRSSSMGYEAQVHVEVVVRSGRIEDVRVTDHHEKQYYSSITDTCQKIIAKQGVTGIDATSCATITSEAIINATAKALAEAGKDSSLQPVTRHVSSSAQALRSHLARVAAAARDAGRVFSWFPRSLLLCRLSVPHATRACVGRLDAR